MDNESNDELMQASATMRGKSYHLVLSELILRLDRLENLLNQEDPDDANFR